MLGLRFCARALSSCGKRGPLFVTVGGPLPLRSTGSRRAGSVVVAHGPSCSAACGIFPDQGSNRCPLHWQADSQPLHHQGSPPAVASSSADAASPVIFIFFCPNLFLNLYNHPLLAVNGVTHFRGSLAEVFVWALCFLVPHVTTNWNMFSVCVSHPQI